METFNLVVLVCAGILTLFNLVDRIISYANKPKELTDDLKRRIEELERKTDEEFKQKFEAYDKELANIRESNKVTQRAILALLKHSIDGNNSELLHKAEEELTDYLTNK